MLSIIPILQIKYKLRKMSWGSNPAMSESKFQALNHYSFGGKIPEGFLQSLLIVYEPTASAY